MAAYMYELVGRFETSGQVMYQVIGLSDAKLYTVNRQTMTTATSRGMVTNVRAQTYNGAIILRGKDGMNINELKAVHPGAYAQALQRGQSVYSAVDAGRRAAKQIEKQERERAAAIKQQRVSSLLQARRA